MKFPEDNDSNEKIVSRNKIWKSNLQNKNKYNSRVHWRKGNQRIGNSTKNVTVFVRDSITKYMKGW